MPGSQHGLELRERGAGSGRRGGLLQGGFGASLQPKRLPDAGAAEWVQRSTARGGTGLSSMGQRRWEVADGKRHLTLGELQRQTVRVLWAGSRCGALRGLRQKDHGPASSPA
jgi:hypothetical protein